jgi:hypothetical protein
MVDHRLQRDPAPFQHDLPAGDARHVQQVVHQARQVRHLAVHHMAQLRDLARIRVKVFEDAHGRADGRERVAQLMRQRGQKFVLAFVGIADLVLPFTRADGRAGGGDQRDGPHRPLHQRHVAQMLHRPLHIQRIRAAAGQKQDGNVRPGGLRRHVIGQRPDRRPADDFFHHQQGAGALLQLHHQVGAVTADNGANAHRAQDFRGQAGVLPGGRADDDPSLHYLIPAVSLVSGPLPT